MKTTNDMAFHKEIEILAERYPFFKYFPMLSENDPEWKGDKGFITFDYMKAKAGASAENYYYLCGPAIMTDGIIAQLEGVGVSKKHIFNEKFVSPESVDPDTIESREVTINFNGQDYSYSGKETILEFLEGEGESIVYACRAGVCGSCVCRLKSGDVDSVTDAGLTDEDIENNSFLACVSYPKSDIVMEADS